MKASDVNPAYLKRHGIETPKRAKYGNKKTAYDGVEYDSALEANCAAQLDRMKRAGLVTGWDRQVKFPLAAGVKYVADFYVVYATGNPRVIDAKGVELPMFKLKRKLFEEKYGPLTVVTDWQAIPAEGHL